MAGPVARDNLVFRRVTLTHGENLLPVLPVVVGDGHSDRRADRLAVPDTAQDVGAILLNAHTAAPAVAFLTSPELAIQENLVDRDTRGKPANHGYKALAVAFARS